MTKAGVKPHVTNPHPDVMRQKDRPLRGKALLKRLKAGNPAKPKAGHGTHAIDPEVLALARAQGVVDHPYRTEEVEAARHETVDLQAGPSRLVRKSGKHRETGGKPIT